MIPEALLHQDLPYAKTAANTWSGRSEAASDMSVQRRPHLSFQLIFSFIFPVDSLPPPFGSNSLSHKYVSSLYVVSLKNLGAGETQGMASL